MWPEFLLHKWCIPCFYITDALKCNRNVIDWIVLVIDATVIVTDWKVIDFFFYFSITKGVNGKPDEPVVVCSRPKKWQKLHVIRMLVYLYYWALACVHNN